MRFFKKLFGKKRKQNRIQCLYGPPPAPLYAPPPIKQDNTNNNETEISNKSDFDSEENISQELYGPPPDDM